MKISNPSPFEFPSVDCQIFEAIESLEHAILSDPTPNVARIAYLCGETVARLRAARLAHRHQKHKPKCKR